MTDIVARLREFALSDDGVTPYNADGDLVREAADVIERLTAALELLATGEPAGAGYAKPMAYKNWVREIVCAALNIQQPTGKRDV